MTSDGEVKQRQHFYHHGDTICHPRSGYVTTKLHGTSTCRCNNNAIFSDRAIFTFTYSFLPKYRVKYPGGPSMYGINYQQSVYMLVQALTLSNLDHWPRGPVDLRSYWPEGQ